jgi:hypothetical protein
VAASIIYIAISVHRALPYWCAIICWLCAMNTIALGAIVVVFVDDNASLVFPELAEFRVGTTNTTI